MIRLVASTAVGPQQRIDLEYDSKGRRIGKKVWNNTAGTGTPATYLKYLYDGWNLVAELDGNSGNVLKRSFSWGLDLSGSERGAGGVGGLLAIKPASGNPTFVAYDGNGNVVGLIDATTGTTAGNFDYGPFGETIRLTPNSNNQSPFRFSTKYQDDEFDLVYYGYRYYNPSTSGWLSRDPIGEDGGANLFAFVYNNPVSYMDHLGLECTSCPKPPPGQTMHTCPTGTLNFDIKKPKMVSPAKIKSIKENTSAAPAFTWAPYREKIKCKRCSDSSCGWKMVVDVDAVCETLYVDDKKVSTLNYIPNQAAMLHHENVCHCADWQAAFNAIIARLGAPHYSSKGDCEKAKKALHFESVLDQEMAPSRNHTDPKYGLSPNNPNASCYAIYTGTF